MNGGRKKWIAEGRELATRCAAVARSRYRGGNADLSLRHVPAPSAGRQCKPHLGPGDVRSPAEFTGEIFAPPGLPETCQRGGHIPGARNIPWSKACQEDGTFLPYDALKAV